MTSFRTEGYVKYTWKYAKFCKPDSIFDLNFVVDFHSILLIQWNNKFVFIYYINYKLFNIWK